MKTFLDISVNKFLSETNLITSIENENINESVEILKEFDADQMDELLSMISSMEKNNKKYNKKSEFNFDDLKGEDDKSAEELKKKLEKVAGAITNTYKLFKKVKKAFKK